MCLSYELKPKQAAKIKAESRKRGYIRVYKVCKNKRTGWCLGLRWRRGYRKAARLKSYDAGWYAYLDKAGASAESRSLSWINSSIKTCYAKPSWIKRLGKSNGRQVGIFTHLCFPDWKTGDMTIREFRAMCKEKP